jgi:hypothetical protein
MSLALFDRCKITRISSATTTGTSTVTSAVIDMEGFSSVAFMAALGTVTNGTVPTLKVKQNTANSTSSPTPTEVTTPSAEECTVTDVAGETANGDMIVTLHRHNPANGRYLFVELHRDTQACVVQGIWAIQYDGDDLPVTQPSSVLKNVVLTPG